MGIVVERPRLRRFLERGGRRLLYGRRKTGKTFYARHVLQGHAYFIVRRGGSVYDPAEDHEMDLRTLLRLCRLLDAVIIDEFHRAHPRLVDALQAGECSGDVVLITSTMHYYRRFVEEPEAPLKGLFQGYQVPLLSPVELLAQGAAPGGPREKLVYATFYQEPSMLGRSLAEILLSGRDFAKSLVGEVLSEEDHAYTTRYDAILEAVALGRERLSEIAQHLHARGLLDAPETGRVTKYLEIMTRTGLLERIEVWGRRRRSVYRHASPLTDIIYYLDARYGLYELPLDEERLLRAAEQRTPLLVERTVERLLAEAHALRPVRILEPEIDIALAAHRRLAIVAEVKWTRSRLGRRELKAIEEKLDTVPAERRILVVPEASQLTAETHLEVLDTEALERLAKDTLERWSSVPSN